MAHFTFTCAVVDGPVLCKPGKSPAGMQNMFCIWRTLEIFVNPAVVHGSLVEGQSIIMNSAVKSVAKKSMSKYFGT